ncbi:HD-GYP domain-containing protein [Candidatus Nitronereus thalassa]|uniref:HD domain-containing protein n=1 Tax=Candidatus Nitronereus thalassa TaxID=3020898 RepID=A0ABU3K339_9BACT|nr:HD domain-containing phosphohydrolase [Candidatus Nitronereus thalassa]MDT7040810.1 HD domain-containing protein [Candidatus Nitronereus thalassa]
MSKLHKNTIPALRLLEHNQSLKSHTIRHFVEAMRRHDPSLVEHGKRTALYSLLLGQALNLPSDDLSDICYAALLHDLGKLSLPNEIVYQHGYSMIGDYLMTECSPQAGADILSAWPGLKEISKLVALHHERWDGHGLPLGMRGSMIPLGARILSIADTVDQLLTQHDQPITEQIDTLVRILRTLAGTRFDPMLVQVLIDNYSQWEPSFSFQDIPQKFWSGKGHHRSSMKTHIIFLILHKNTATPEIPYKSCADPHLRNILEVTQSLFSKSVMAY